MTSTQTQRLIRVGHSPDPDDAFMFHALANDRIDSGDYCFTHELVDIETLNQRAFQGELELTAISIHAYAFLYDKYALCSCGASMGDGYGPMVVAKQSANVGDLASRTIAIPGKLTSAFLALQLCLERPFEYVEVPFDRIIPAVVAGQYEGQSVDAGLIIHEGQLTYGDQNLQLIVDLGQWWGELTDGLPLPLGANAIRRDLGDAAMRDVQRLLLESIRYGLEHRAEALEYALQYGRDLDRSKADKFVGMYVNDLTLDYGPDGREGIRRLLGDAHEAGLIPEAPDISFV